MKMEKIFVEKGSTMKETMRQIDRNGLGVAFIIDKNRKFLGLITDGDIRRAILDGKGLDLPIEQIMNSNPLVVNSGLSNQEIKDRIKKEGFFKNTPEQLTIRIPVLNKDKTVEKTMFFLKNDIGNHAEICTKTSGKKPVKRVLVIGGAGYLGSVMVRKLLGKGYKVRVFDNLTYGNAGIIDLLEKKNFEFIEGDMRDLSAVTSAIKDVDAVIHLAAIVGDPASALVPKDTIEINYLAAKMVAEACKCHQINRFVFASTCSVYGASKTPEDFLDENSEVNEVSLYAKMKRMSEKALLEMQDENFSPTILRLSTLFGLSPRMTFELVVNLITAKAVFENRITIFGGSQWRPFLHVADAADAFIKCIELPFEKVCGKIFNTGGNKGNCQIKDIGKIVHRVMPEAKFVVTDAEDKRNYRVLFDKIKKELEFEPKKSIEEGVIEIKEKILSGKIQDYKKKEYNNYMFLKEKNKKAKK